MNRLLLSWFWIFFCISTSLSQSNSSNDTNSFLNQNGENHQILAEHQFSTSKYVAGQQFTVTLQITNEFGESQQIRINETIPKHWDVDNISHQGSYQDNKITWKFSLPPGQTQLGYRVTPKSDIQKVVFFQCAINDGLPLAQTFLEPHYNEIDEPIPGVWRSWTAEDGLTESWTFGVTLTPSGNVIAKHGGVPTIEYLNGYRIEDKIPVPIPLRNTTQFIFEGIDGTLWAEHPDINQKNYGFSVYRNDQWKEYKLEIIEKLNVLSNQMRFFPINKNEVLFFHPEGLKNLISIKKKSL